MHISLFNSLTRKKSEFKPINQNKIRIYACGPTVYSFAHIGNARMAVVCDLLVKVLKTKYKTVDFVSNITDVDDKIIEAANQAKEPIKKITEKFHRIYNEDMKNLGVDKPNIQPKATDFIQEMIKIIEKLIKNQCAYIADENVLFDVKKYKFYGILSRRSKDEQIAGSRVEVASYKRNSQDFILWKPSKKDEPGWNSPWGVGRPGWHIECSAMSQKCLGIPFDIHCGGVDLTFPHHENEIAQSCSAFSLDSKPETFCKYWFHNGFVTFSGEKMSKSLGNIQLVNDLLKKYSGEVIRLSLISSHYRQPLDWSINILNQSERTLERFSKIISENKEIKEDSIGGEKLFSTFLDAVYDDLNTPRALGILNAWFNSINKEKISEKKKIKSAILKALKTLGIVLENINSSKKFNSSLDGLDKKLINEMIKEREIARNERDFLKADQIREKLKDLDIELEDTENGTTWKRIKKK